MKMFIKLFGIPQSRKPDYDFINQLEHEFGLNQDGFDRRYDRMLFDDFMNRWQNEQWDYNKIEEELENLYSNVVTLESMDRIDYIVLDVYEQRSIDDDVEIERHPDNLRSILLLNDRERNR